MRKILALAALLLATPALAQAPAPDQIDYFLMFANGPAALTAGVALGIVTPACPSCTPPTTVQFSGASVISGPNGIAVYKTTAITPYNATTAPNCPCETRVPIGPTKYWALVSTIGRNAGIEALGAAVVMLVGDRTLACAGAPASAFLLANNTGFTPAQLGYGGVPSVGTPTLHIQPLFGCDPGSAKYPSSNPWGLGGGK